MFDFTNTIESMLDESSLPEVLEAFEQVCRERMHKAGDEAAATYWYTAYDRIRCLLTMLERMQLAEDNPWPPKKAGMDV